MTTEAESTQFKDFTFALRDAWPYIHSSGSETLRSDASKLMHETGDFALEDPKVGANLNRRLFHVLMRAQAHITNDQRKKALSRVLHHHSQAQEGWILSGNRPDGDLPPRDHSMRAKEYWESRPYPAQLHHWTGLELRQHLNVHNYPPNTIKDRLEGHVKKICDALVSGLYVPPEVMADDAGQRATADAIMTFKANRYASEASERQEENRLAFVFAAGRAGGWRSALSDLLLRAAKAIQHPAKVGLDKWIAGGFKVVEMDGGYPHPIMVCAFDDSKGCRVDLRDGRYEPNSLYATFHSIRMDEACSIYRELLDQGKVSQAEIELVIGYQGMQYMPQPVVTARYPREG